MYHTYIQTRVGREHGREGTYINQRNGDLREAGSITRGSKMASGIARTVKRKRGDQVPLWCPKLPFLGLSPPEAFGCEKWGLFSIKISQKYHTHESSELAPDAALPPFRAEIRCNGQKNLPAPPQRRGSQNETPLNESCGSGNLRSTYSSFGYLGVFYRVPAELQMVPDGL